MRIRSAELVATIVAMVIASGCTSVTVSGGPPSSPPASSVASAAPATAVPATAQPGITPGPGAASPSATAGSPPPATLAILAGGSPIPGDLGSYTWDGFASDGPWVVGTASHAATAGAEVRVSLAGGPAPVAWEAVWAPLRKGQPGAPVAAGSGSEGITVLVPAQPGEWSLRVTASFGEGRQAAWYWRLAAVP